LGINETGLIVAITNRPKTGIPAEPRSPEPRFLETRSRGLLCRDLLDLPSVESALQEALRQLRAEPFDGCNVILAGTERGVLIEAGDRIRTIPLPPGIHTITNGSLNDPHDSRLERLDQSLQRYSTPERGLDDWLGEAKRLCGLSSKGDQPALCLPGGSRGTVSATIIALTAEPTGARYLHADGPPDQTPFRDDSPVLRRMLLAGRSVLAPPHRISPHHISLRGPWQYEWVSPPVGGVPQRSSGRTAIPVTWQELFGSIPGTARFRRRFHRPTNLEPHEQVRILFENLGGSAIVSLNGTLLGTIPREQPSAEFNATDHLQPSNELTVDLTFNPRHDSAAHTGLLTPVIIEIRPV